MNEANKKAYTRTEGEYEHLERQLAEAIEFANYKIKLAEHLTKQNNLLMDKLKEQGE